MMGAMGPLSWIAGVVLVGSEPSFVGEAACGLEPPEMALLAPAVTTKPHAVMVSDEAFVRRVDALDADEGGVLRGKTVYVSAGHGLIWTGSAWRTQRGNTNDIVEDLVAVEAVNEYVVPYLHAMGAHVVTVRDPGLPSPRVIVDDLDAMVEGSPNEVDHSDVGWGEVALPIVSDSTNPFAAGGARILVAGAQQSGGLVYVPEIPSTGHYPVYVSFVQGADRVSDAHYVVRHSGGESHIRVDQRRHGSTWVFLGEFYFEAGAPASRASVAVLDDSADVGAFVSCDAVRFGTGAAVHDRGGGDNGRPMYEQAARYYTQWNGAPTSVFAAFDGDGTSDVSTRSRFAAWDVSPGEDAVYVAWHSNAPNPRVGTSTYSYGSSAPPGPLSNFSGVAGSRELQDFVHFEIIDDLRAAWDPQWADEGRFTAYFGEVNPNHNPHMPAILVEVAYHDTPADATQLRDPRFRQLVARAMAQGIARYYADKDGTPLVLPPEPPEAVWITNDGDGGLEVRWMPPGEHPGAGDAPDAYLVQVGTNGYGFDDGTLVAGTSLTLEGLEPHDVRHVRIVAINAGGRSLPSQTVSAAVAPSGQASVLVVAGFDRLDGWLLVPEALDAFALGTVRRMWLRRINDGSYSVRHAHAIAAAGFSFDGATDDAIELAELGLASYQAVDWFTGEDSVGDDPLPALSRDILTDYLDDGGALLISGAELGWVLDEHGAPEEREFFHERLHARYLLDDAETYDVSPVPGPLQTAPALSFADPTAYDPRFPDVFDPEPGGALALSYDNGAGVGAGIAWGQDGGVERGVILGFPFETVAGEEVRAELMLSILQFFEVQEEPGPDPDDDDDGDDDTGESDTSDTTSAGTRGEGDTDALPELTDEGDGCGCRHVPGHRSLGWLVLVSLAGAARRRQRRT
jgi:MYXO-CTERM domain-containing protein